MSPEAHLIDTWWFRGAIVVPVSIALLVGWYFTGDINLELERSPTGMNLFLKMFKLPLGIAGLALPVVAVVAANHRSIQTAQQIKDQNAQSIFSNHLEHRDFFSKFIEERKPFGNMSVDTARLYEAMFPKAVDGDLKPKSSMVNEVLHEISETLFTLSNQSTKHLNKKNLRLPKNSAETVRSSIKQVESAITSKVFSITSTETEKLFYDPVEVIRSVRIRLSTIATGLIKSANFHRYYVKQSDLDTVSKVCGQIDQTLNDFSEIYDFFKTIKLAVEEYLDPEGNIKHNDGMTDQRFLQRLADINNAMKTNKISTESIGLIFENHIEKNHRVPFYLNAPADWRQHLNLSEQERGEMLRAQFRSAKT